jgi:hypothetical protein
MEFIMTNKNQQLDEFAPPANSATVEPSAGLLPDGTVDREGAMAKADLFKLSNYSYKLFKKINDEDQLEAWIQAKITKAADYIASVYHYLEYEMKFSEYGKKLENSDMYTESEKQIIQQKLNEARAAVKALKVTQASKLLEGTSAKKDKDFAALAAPVDKITYADKIAGANKKAKAATSKVAKEGLAEDNYSDDDDYVKRPYMPKSGKYADSPFYDPADAEEDAEKAYKDGIKKREQARKNKNKKDIDESAKPSAGLSKAKKSATVEKAKKRGDIGKPGKNFEKVASKAAKKYGSKKAGDKVAAAAMWNNIKEGVEISFGEGVYASDAQQTEDLSGDVAKLNKPEKFPPVVPKNIKGARPAGNTWDPDPDEYSAGLSEPTKSVKNIKPSPSKTDIHPAIAKLQKTHPKLYAYMIKTPGSMQKFLSNSSYAIDLLTKPEFQPVFKEDQQLDELNLNPWKKQSPYTKQNYKLAADRQRTKMQNAADATEEADEKGDNAGIKKAGQEWRQAKARKEKAERKASLAKKESINESAEVSAIKILSGLQ